MVNDTRWSWGGTVLMDSAPKRDTFSTSSETSNDSYANNILQNSTKFTEYLLCIRNYVRHDYELRYGIHPQRRKTKQEIIIKQFINNHLILKMTTINAPPP